MEGPVAMQRFKYIIVSSAVALALTAANLSAQQSPSRPGGTGGGGGTATLTEQQVQTGHLSDIATGVGSPTDTGCTAGSDGNLNCKVKNLTALVDALGTTLSTLNAKFPTATTPADNTALGAMSSMFVVNGCYDGSTVDLCVKADAGAGSTSSATQRVVLAYDSGVCNAKNASQLAVSVSSSGNNELVALTASQTIYVCDLTLLADGAVDVQLIYGTGTACATGETNMSGLMKLVATGAGWTHDYGGRLKTAEANALCLELSGAVAVNGILTYRKAATF